MSVSHVFFAGGPLCEEPRAEDTYVTQPSKTTCRRCVAAMGITWVTDEIIYMDTQDQGIEDHADEKPFVDFLASGPALVILSVIGGSGLIVVLAVIARRIWGQG